MTAVAISDKDSRLNRMQWEADGGVRLDLLGFVSFPSGHRGALHSHPFWELIYIGGGKGFLHHGDKVRPCAAEEISSIDFDRSVSSLRSCYRNSTLLYPYTIRGLSIYYRYGGSMRSFVSICLFFPRRTRVRVPSGSCDGRTRRLGRCGPPTASDPIIRR